MKKVLVAGATGMLGYEVVKQLKAAGYWVRALSRNKERAEKLVGLADNVFLGDPLDSSTLSGLCADIDIVFSAMGKSMSLFNHSTPGFYEVDYLGNRNILLEVLKSGTSRFVYISVHKAAEKMAFEYSRAHELFADELRRSPLSYTIIEPVGLFSGLQDMLLLAQKGLIFTLGKGLNKTNPIHPQDLAELCVEKLEKGEKELAVGGPQVLSRTEIAQLACVSCGCKANIHIPVTLTDFSMLFLPFVNHHGLYDKLAFFRHVLTHDEVAPAYGSQLLGEYFQNTASELKVLPENF